MMALLLANKDHQNKQLSPLKIISLIELPNSRQPEHVHYMFACEY